MHIPQLRACFQTVCHTMAMLDAHSLSAEVDQLVWSTAAITKLKCCSKPSDVLKHWSNYREVLSTMSPMKCTHQTSVGTKSNELPPSVSAIFTKNVAYLRQRKQEIINDVPWLNIITGIYTWCWRWSSWWFWHTFVGQLAQMLHTNRNDHGNMCNYDIQWQ